MTSANGVMLSAPEDEIAAPIDAERALIAHALVDERIAQRDWSLLRISPAAGALLGLIAAYGAACRAVGCAAYAATTFGVTDDVLVLARDVDLVTVAELAAAGPVECIVDELRAAEEPPASPWPHRRSGSRRVTDVTARTTGIGVLTLSSTRSRRYGWSERR